MKADRYYQLTLVAIALLGVLLQITSLGPLRAQFWGFHLLAFLPAAVAVSSWLLVLVAAAWLLGARRPAILAAAFRKLEKGPAPWLALLLLGAVFGCAFWLLRSEQTVLGDAAPLISNLPKGLNFHPRQPLTMSLQQFLYQRVGDLLESGARDDVAIAARSVALGSVASGILFVAVAYGLGWTFARCAGKQNEASRAAVHDARITALLVCLTLLFQGYALLFYGYLENYAFHTLFVALYLLCSLQYLRGRIPLVVPILVLLLDLGLHLSAVGLLPSLVFLCGWGVANTRTRNAAVRDLALGVAAVFLLNWGLSSMSPEYSLWVGVRGIVKTGTSDQGGGSGITYLLSGRHHRDFFNEQYLIGPLAAFLLVPALVFTWLKKGTPTASVAFLGLAALSFLGSSWTAPEPALGYARDWDLFAPTGVVFAAAGLYLLVQQVATSQQRIRLLLFAALVSFLHLSSWVLVSHSEPRSMARFALLPLGLGRNQVVIGNWHMRHGRIAEAEEWFLKALEVNPYNNNAYALLGIVYAKTERMHQAAEVYRKAVRMRPDKPNYRQNLIAALTAEKRYEETLPHHEFLCDAQPDDIERWLAYVRALRILGRHEEAKAVLRRALPRFEAQLRKSPADFESNNNVGGLLAHLDRPDEALEFFQRALRAQPHSGSGLFNVGSMLMRLDRRAEAVPYLRRLLELHPDHVMRGQVERWLAEIDSH
ncbi:MAG: tetratricopeptide repeat protein [Candidatus Krumholzibacteriia bacterium]